MKHRGSSKIKYEHGMIAELRKFLESIESWEEIVSIIPGIIKPTKTHGQFVFQIQYSTITGIKCLAKSDGAVQEVFIVAKDIESITKKINAL
jgi:hypothetical protein